MNKSSDSMFAEDSSQNGSLPAHRGGAGDLNQQWESLNGGAKCNKSSSSVSTPPKDYSQRRIFSSSSYPSMEVQLDATKAEAVNVQEDFQVRNVGTLVVQDHRQQSLRNLQSIYDPSKRQHSVYSPHQASSTRSWNKSPFSGREGVVVKATMPGVVSYLTPVAADCTTPTRKNLSSNKTPTQRDIRLDHTKVLARLEGGRFKSTQHDSKQRPKHDDLQQDILVLPPHEGDKYPHPANAFDWLLDDDFNNHNIEQPSNPQKKREEYIMEALLPGTADQSYNRPLPKAKRIVDDLEYAVEIDLETQQKEQAEKSIRRRHRNRRHRCYLYWSIGLILSISVLFVIVWQRHRPWSERMQQYPREYIGIRQVAGLLFLQPEHSSAPPELLPALDWIIRNDTIVITDANFYQRLVLVGVYFALRGDTWSGHCGNSTLPWCTIVIDGTLQSARPWLTPFSECEWAGIGCDAQGNIVEVQLNDIVRNCQVVPFAWLHHLPFLQSLRLTKAACETIPDLSYHVARHYRTIALDRNDFRKNIPSSWYAALPNVRVLQLSGNFLTGSLSNDLTQLKSLKRLDLQGNRLNGTIPNVFDQLKSIAFVWMNGNRFNGRIPPTLLQVGGVYTNQSVSAISNIDLGDNRLTGEIPTVAARNWNTLRFDRNLLSGTLPLSLLEQTGTLELDVSFNRLTGTMSSTFGEWTNVARLDLSYNAFTGSLPSEIRSLPKIEKLILNRNTFDGRVPETWCQRETLGLPKIQDLRADCLIEANGFVETPCSCCSVCCNDDGGECLVYPPSRG